jgi:hypothetical protein
LPKDNSIDEAEKDNCKEEVMKIQQAKTFQPITITIETAREAELFIGIIDKVDAWHCHSSGPPHLTLNEYELVRTISDAFTDEVGLR